MNVLRDVLPYSTSDAEVGPEKVRYKVIGVEMKGMESSMKLEALGAITAQRLGRYGRGMDPCAKICRPAHGSMSQGEWIEMY